MRRNYSNARQNIGIPGYAGPYYNVALLHRYRERVGLTVHAIGVAIGMNPDTCAKVFKGRASHKQVWRVAVFLKADWAKLHDLSIRTSDELDRAVFTRKAVRSSGSVAVGVSQTRPVRRGGTYTRAQR